MDEKDINFTEEIMETDTGLGVSTTETSTPVDSVIDMVSALTAPVTSNPIPFDADSLPSSLNHLVHGYMDYAKEVVLERALPNIDGFKPAQRRILYTMKYMDKVTDLTKSAGISGSTMKIHPHNDASIYDTMVRMTESARYMTTPFIQGKGSFGHVFSSDEKPAASRYTECMLAKMADEVFKGMNGIEMIPSYDNKYEEPLLLPVSFPNILCNPTQGIAVGIATNIPSFNFHELLKATIELIKTGSIKKVLAPDFPTGGCYVLNEHELQKLMSTGNAKLKLRGKWRIEGKVIIIDEIPYYTTVEEIKDAVKDLPGVVDAKDESDKRGLCVTIECQTKKIVDEVLREVLRVSNLQMNITTNIVVIIDNKPKVTGVTEILEEWVKFRKSVIAKELSVDIERLSKLIARYDILVDLMTTDKREPFLQTIFNSDPEDKSAEMTLLCTYYPNVATEIFEWILDRKITSLKGVGNKQREYIAQLTVEKEEQEAKLVNLDATLIAELESLNKKYKLKRCTEIVDDTYTFEGYKKKKAEPIPVLVQFNGLFLKKLKNVPSNAQIEGTVKAMSEDIISYLDVNGRLLRVQLDQIDFCTVNDKGTYLPRYFDLTEDFKILDTQIIGNKKRAYMFNDGYAAIIDYAEWHTAKRRLKITEDGLAPGHMDKYVGKFRLDHGFVVMKTQKGKLAYVPSNFLQKSRKARTKLISLGKGDYITDVVSMTQENLAELVQDPARFEGHFRVINKQDGFNAELFAKMVQKRG